MAQNNILHTIHVRSTGKGGFRRPGKIWSVVVAVATVVAAARVQVAAVVMATIAVVLVSPLTLYRPSATVLIHLVLKLKIKKRLKN